ncbi:hypothetical protein JAN5088_01024 [Jannaschia rubra]|uniref:Uncharacterized protein n=2 Tax=Jannaschia rubra TaxID=282197 RepID=A0A0M6XQ26_9RHOB|nr:hypothetical protein JAN5088_01024 [Jannaschia rubra]SFG48787.1 Peroxiredoxin [Jannaschia rubra]
MRAAGNLAVSSGIAMPPVVLTATDGCRVDVSRIDGLNVLLFLPDAADAMVAIWRDGYVARRKAGLDRVVGIAASPVADLQDMRRRLGLPFHLLSDEAGLLRHALGIPKSPMTLILRDGRIAGGHASCADALRHLPEEICNVA